MTRSLIVVLLLLVAGSCSLRPRYLELVPNLETPGRFVLLNPELGNAPISGAVVEMSEWKNKVTVTTKADGSFTLPVDKRYVTENPVVVVSLPKGVTQYRIEKAKEPVSAPVEVAAPQPELPRPEVDAGVEIIPPPSGDTAR